MAALKEGSDSRIEFAARRRTTKVVRKWSEEQTDLFATLLSVRYSKDGREESSWAQDLENLAMKKSSNDKLFREVQASLEEELVNIGQSIRDHDEEATFSVPQLRAKYKWLKREWKIFQSKIGYGLLSKEEHVKIPGWHKLLDPVFSVFQSSSKDEHINERPSMVNENGLLHNGESNRDGVSDCYATVKESMNGTCVESFSTKSTKTSALNRRESFEVEEEDKTKLKIDQTHNGVESSERARVAPITIVRVPINTVDTRDEDVTSHSPPRKTRKRALVSNERTNENNYEARFPPSRSGCDTNQCDRYVEIIKYLLDAEERRERMFVDFQKEQAKANREHELKMAQFFAQSLSHQQSLSNGISQILQAFSKNNENK